MKYLDEYGNTFRRSDSGRKKLRFICIFLIVATVSAVTVWLTLPDDVKKKKTAAGALSDKNAQTETTVDPVERKKTQPEKTGEGSAIKNVTADVSAEEKKKVPASDAAQMPPAAEVPRNSGAELPKGTPGPGDIPKNSDKPEIPGEKNAEEADKKLLEIKKLYQQGRFAEAADKAALLLQKLTAGSLASRKALQLLSDANWERFLRNDCSGGFAAHYTVAAGDYLGRIAWKNQTTVAGIMKANKLKNSNIRIGQKLCILSGKWKITVSKAKRQLFLWRGKNLFMGYDIGIGRFGKTPTADFVIMDRLKNPVYRTSDGRIFKHGRKENELGDYFLKLASAGAPKRPLLGYGIHGTPDESSVTRSLSNGCIRMRNADVERLYYIVPTGTGVEIRD